MGSRGAWPMGGLENNHEIQHQDPTPKILSHKLKRKMLLKLLITEQFKIKTQTKEYIGIYLKKIYDSVCFLIKTV